MKIQDNNSWIKEIKPQRTNNSHTRDKVETVLLPS